MDQLVIVGCLCLLLLSCSEEPPPPPAPVNNTQEEPETLMFKEQDGKMYPVLDNNNVVAFLKKYGKENPETNVVMHTDFGDIKLKLYKDVPLHRANFVMMAKRGYFDHTVFYRVVENFLIQGGNSESDDKGLHRMRIGTYRIPQEFSSAHIHERGALAMARDYVNNDPKASNPYNFYIVIGEKWKDNTLNDLEDRDSFRFSERDRDIYKSKGGTPHLDNEHTVFGELVDGMDVVREIARQPKDESDWPIEDLKFTVEVY